MDKRTTVGIDLAKDVFAILTCPQLVCQLLVSESKVVICSLLPYQSER
jgi:hypothetical protein